MKLTDLLSKVLKKNSVKNVYGLQGGADSAPPVTKATLFVKSIFIFLSLYFFY